MRLCFQLSGNKNFSSSIGRQEPSKLGSFVLWLCDKTLAAAPLSGGIVLLLIRLQPCSFVASSEVCQTRQ